MVTDGRHRVRRNARTAGVWPLVVSAGVFVFSPVALSADVQHVTLEVEDLLGIPAIQALIVSCIGELVYFTGTVRITYKDGVAAHSNWGPMRGETADGDVFVAASAATVGGQSSLTVVEVGAGLLNRQFVLHTFDGEPSVTCHNYL